MDVDMNRYQNQMNYDNNAYHTSQINKRKNGMYYQINNNQKNYTSINNNLYSYDKRLVLSLKYLGLSKFIPNFIKKGTRFEDFLSFSNSDLTSFKIPHDIQDIIQKFILAYLNFGSLYTIDEINKFFKTKKVKKYFPKNEELNRNEMIREKRNNIKYKSVNQKNNTNINNNYNGNIILNNYNNQRNLSNNQNNHKKRPKSHNNKLISVPNDYFNVNNIKQKIFTNNNHNNINTNKINNFRISSNKISNNNNNIKRKKIPNNIYGNTTNSNSNISSLPSNQNNFNKYSTSIDNFSHMAMNGNSPQLLNMMKMANFKNINNNNINQLKKNLVKNFSKTKKGKINDNNNENAINRNKKVIVDNKYENIGLSRSTSKDIIERLNEVLKKNESRKKSNNSSTILNINNKGYYSDGYLKEKHNINKNMNIEGYEINTFYAGDTSKFKNFGPKDNFNTEIKRIKNGGNIINNSKTNKAKKINEDQERKIEYLLSHGGNSSLKYNDYLMMNYYDINNDDEFSSTNYNKSKTSMSNNYINLANNTNHQQLFPLNNNNLNSKKQKNLLIQRQNNKNKIIKSRPNNFNNYASNRGNISSNNYQNNNNIIHIPNQQIRSNKKEGPVQISVKNRKKITNSNYINISPNFNNNIKERGNNFNINNNSMSNFSQKNNNLNNYLFNNYINGFVDMNNNNLEHKRSTKSYDKHSKNRFYQGIHNINNNINNININNINYDGKRLSDGFNSFNNLGDFDIKMNYHRTQDNFYDPNNLLNNNGLFNDFY